MAADQPAGPLPTITTCSGISRPFEIRGTIEVARILETVARPVNGRTLRAAAYEQDSFGPEEDLVGSRLAADGPALIDVHPAIRRHELMSHDGSQTRVNDVAAVDILLGTAGSGREDQKESDQSC